MVEKRVVEIVRVPGYNPGERVPLSANAARTYCRNGQAKPVGWSLEDEERTKGPQNRMLDTGRDRVIDTRPRRRGKTKS